MSKVELKCSWPDHATNAHREGWDDGVLVTSIDAKTLPVVVCRGCGQHRNEVYEVVMAAGETPMKQLMTKLEEQQGIIVALQQELEAVKVDVAALESKDVTP